jgi:hypothetical protein
MTRKESNYEKQIQEKSQQNNKLISSCNLPQNEKLVEKSIKEYKTIHKQSEI